VIDQRDQPEAIRHGFEGRDIAMLVGAEGALGLRMGQEPVEELGGCAEMEQRDRPRFTIDAARLHDAVVSVSTRFDFLNACHRLDRHGVEKRVKPLKMRKRAFDRLCIPFLAGQKSPKSGSCALLVMCPSLGTQGPPCHLSGT
jgi:hypothetical protein